MKSIISKIISLVISVAYRSAHRIRRLYWKISKIKTHGVRIIFIRDDKVLLIQHWYNNLWVFPGGRIKKNQSIVEAAMAEAGEEVHIVDIVFDRRLGTYQNKTHGKDDVVTILVAESWREAEGHSLLEIKRTRWVPLSDLPKGISEATKKRLDECLAGQVNIEGLW